jgi:hypothetical protein
MLRIIPIVLLACLCLGFASAQEHPDAVPSILPAPQHIIAKKVVFKIGSATRIVLGSDSKEERFAASVFETELHALKEMQLKISGESEIRKLPASTIFIGSPSSKYGKQFLAARKEKLSPAMKAEGYLLDVEPSGIFIVAESEAGKFYGVMSLLQLMRRDKRSVVVPAVTIHDFPSEKMRGISDDISRGQISTLENFKKIIRMLARYKLNVYSPYIEDMFAFTRHPLIGKERGALTAKEVKELDAYARQYHVEMIPVFETLGHWENILAIPEYVGYGEFPGAHTLNVSDERIYKLLDEMIGELAAAFSSPWFNMAADESHDVGLGANKNRVAQTDIATVHAEHYKRVLAILKKHGKKALMYGDVILNNPTILDKIPKEIVFVDWHYGAAEQYTSPAIFHKAGFPFLVCPAVWSFTGPFPNYWNSFVNIQHLNRDGVENGSLGLLTSNWNDYGGEALRELNYLGYAWTAQCSWSPEQSDAVRCQRAFFSDFFGTDDVNGMMSAYAILSDPTNQYHWNELWRHPFVSMRVPQRDDRPSLVLRGQSIVSTMPLVLDLVRDAGAKVKKNGDHLRYLEFVANLNLCFAEKLSLQEELKRFASAGSGKDSLAALLVPRCADLLKELVSLKSEFEQLWLQTNKAAGLEYLIKRYDRQIAAWKDIVKQLKSGTLDKNPVIESFWIYHPDAHPGERDSSQVKKAYFRKTVVSQTGVRSAKLQLIGDTHAECFVNGKPVGQVAGRRSLSLLVEHQRVKIFDIAPLLVDSVNIIAVEVENFAPTGSAGVNVYAEIQNNDEKIVRIMTDSTWKTDATAADGWKEKNFVDEQWKSAAVRAYPNPVTKPDFATGRASWIER